MPYPVSLTVAPPATPRNRLTTAFRLVLAVPHLILVGGSGTTFGGGGLLGAVAGFLAVISWFSIVLTGQHPNGIRQFTRGYLRWRARGLAYLMLLEDTYPPFGDEPYPVELDVADAAEPRDRLAVGLRILLAIPHLAIMFFVMLAWACATVAAWFLLLFTGECPQGLYDFSVGALRWRLRVEAYLLLMVDDYPPFSLT